MCHATPLAWQRTPCAWAAPPPSHGHDDLEPPQELPIDCDLDGLPARRVGGAHYVGAQQLLLLLRVPQHGVHLAADGDAARDDEHLQAGAGGASLGGREGGPSLCDVGVVIGAYRDDPLLLHRQRLQQLLELGHSLASRWGLRWSTRGKETLLLPQARIAEGGGAASLQGERERLYWGGSC